MQKANVWTGPEIAPKVPLPEMPLLKKTEKKQPYWTFNCNFPLKRGKKCKHKDGGANPGPLQFRANQHWAKHLKETQE